MTTEDRYNELPSRKQTQKSPPTIGSPLEGARRLDDSHSKQIQREEDSEGRQDVEWVSLRRCGRRAWRPINASSGRSTDPRCPSAFPTNSKNSRDSISIRYQNASRLQGNEEKDKKYVPLPSIAIETNPTVKELRQRGFRTWQDSTGFHRQEAALVDYEAGIVHLSSSDGVLLEIPENKLSGVD